MWQHVTNIVTNIQSEKLGTKVLTNFLTAKIDHGSLFQSLMVGLIEEQKGLIARLEKGKGTMKPEEKKAIMGILKELSTSIDRYRIWGSSSNYPPL